jgi:hypothetical protein
MMAVVIGCSRTGLDAIGGVGANDDSGFPVVTTDDGSVVGDDASAVDAFVAAQDVSPASQEETGAPGPQPDASEHEAEAAAGETDGAATDALPGPPCLERKTVDCGCNSDVCASQDRRLARAVFDVTQNCPLACGDNYFTFDGDGCVTSYTHDRRQMANEACILQELGNVRFSCTTGVAQPLRVYFDCTIQ